MRTVIRRGPRLRPQIGLLGLTVDGVGDILGAGIYVLIGPAVALAGSGVWLAFVLASLVALLAALNYAELASAYPGAGAEYDYLGRTFRSGLPAFLVGWILCLNGVASIATVALGFGGYLHRLLPLDPRLGALLLVAALTGLALLGLRHDTHVNYWFTAVEAGGLVAVIVLGGLHWGHASVLSWPHGLGGVLGATGIVFFAVTGFEDMTKVSEEVQRARRTVPVSLVLAVGLAGLLYTAFSLAIVQLASPADLAGSGSPVSTALAGHWESLAADLLAGVALFATANTALVVLLAHSRLVFAMARGGSLPGFLTPVWSGTSTPWVATLVVGGLSAALLPLGDVALLGSVGSWTSLVVYAATSVALVVLRFRRPDLVRPFRVPLSIGRVPLPSVLAIALTLGLSLQLSAEVALGGLAVAAVGVAVYVLWAGRHELRSPVG